MTDMGASLWSFSSPRLLTSANWLLCAMTSLWSFSSPLLYCWAHWMFYGCVLLPLRILIVYGGLAISCLLAWNLLWVVLSSWSVLGVHGAISTTEYHSNRPGIL
jgi:hypothetical protein